MVANTGLYTSTTYSVTNCSCNYSEAKFISLHRNRMKQNEKLVFARPHDPFSDQTGLLDSSLQRYVGGSWNSQTFGLV